jgi:hypothetical protein
MEIWCSTSQQVEGMLICSSFMIVQVFSGKKQARLTVPSEDVGGGIGGMSRGGV